MFMELTKTSKDIWDEMKRCDLYWKSMESMDEDEEIICRLGQM